MPVVNVGPQEWVVLVDHTETNSLCKTTTIGVDVTKKVTYSWTIGGKVTLGGSVEWAAGALFTKCKAKAGIEFEGSGTRSKTTEEAVAIKSSTTVEPCTKVNYTVKKLKKTASGSITTWDHKIVCVKGTKKETKYCNKVTLTGSVVGWGETEGVWTSLGKVNPCPCDETMPEPDPIPEPDPMPEPDPVPEPVPLSEPVPIP